MYLLNLSLLQFLAVFGSISAVAVALYLLDRSRRRQVVSTLRFWVAAEQPAVAARRRRIQQPWSLLLQLAGMVLLLLAVAQLRLGTPGQAGRDHVIVLETSAWMAARSGNRTLMDLAKERARRYLHALPARDRVMLVRADALATPATVFEPDRKKVEAAIDASEPGSTALNLDQALGYARHVQEQAGGRAGEIAFAGAGRTLERDASDSATTPPRLRLLLVPDAIENAGLRKVGVRRSGTDADLWEIYVSAHNYGSEPRRVTLAIDYGPPDAGRVPAGAKQLTLPAGGDRDVSFEYRTASAGVLGVTLTPHDAFPSDDHAELELPSQPKLSVTVYSNEPELLRPLLASSPRVVATYRKPEEYRPADKGLVILDRFAPPQRPTADAVWIDPPAESSPIAVKQTVENEAFHGWDTGHPIAAGLRAKDFKLEKALVFEPGDGVGRVAEVQEGPVIVARTGERKTVVLGFHPALSPMRYELAAPLLFANLLRWMSPEIFRRWELSVGSVGTVKLMLDQDAPENEVKVLGAAGEALPFTMRDKVVHFFAGKPGMARVVAGDREYIYSLTLPQLWDSRWDPPPDAMKGIPRFPLSRDAFTELWPWLAVAGAGALLAEWLLYGRFRRAQAGGVPRPMLLRRRASVSAEGRR